MTFTPLLHRLINQRIEGRQKAKIQGFSLTIYLRSLHRKVFGSDICWLIAGLQSERQVVAQLAGLSHHYSLPSSVLNHYRGFFF
jgi:hypothetical protein